MKDPNAEEPKKGFYISFDNEAPKRPKPPLRTKRSPKKEGDGGLMDHQNSPMDSNDRFATTTRKSAMDHNNHENSMRSHVEPIPAKRHHITDTSADRYSYEQQMQQRKHLEDVTNYEPQMHNASYNNGSNSANNEPRTNESGEALVIGNNLDPVRRNCVSSLR